MRPAPASHAHHKPLTVLLLIASCLFAANASAVEWSAEWQIAPTSTIAGAGGTPFSSVVSGDTTAVSWSDESGRGRVGLMRGDEFHPPFGFELPSSPTLATDGSRFVAAFFDGNLLQLAEVTVEGVRLGAAIPVVSTYAPPRITVSGTRFLVTWMSESRAWGALFDDPAEPTEPFLISTACTVGFRTTANASQYAVLLWTDKCGPSSNITQVVFVSRDGTPAPALLLGDGTPRFAAALEDSFIFAWYDYASLTNRLTRMSPAGTVTHSTVIRDAPDWIAVTDDALYLFHGNRITAMNHALETIRPATVPGPASPPESRLTYATDGDLVRVTWGASFHRTHLVSAAWRLSDLQPTEYARGIFFRFAEQYAATVASLGDTWAIAWMQERDDARPDIHYVIGNANGISEPTLIRKSSLSQVFPALAASNREFGLVWDEQDTRADRDPAAVRNGWVALIEPDPPHQARLFRSPLAGGDSFLQSDGNSFLRSWGLAYQEFDTDGHFGPLIIEPPKNDLVEDSRPAWTNGSYLKPEVFILPGCQSSICPKGVRLHQRDSTGAKIADPVSLPVPSYSSMAVRIAGKGRTGRAIVSTYTSIFTIPISPAIGTLELLPDRAVSDLAIDTVGTIFAMAWTRRADGNSTELRFTMAGPTSMTAAPSTVATAIATGELEITGSSTGGIVVYSRRVAGGTRQLFAREFHVTPRRRAIDAR